MPVPGLCDRGVVISAAIGFDDHPLISPEEVDLEDLPPNRELYVRLRDRQAVMGQQRQHLGLHPASQPDSGRVPAPGFKDSIQLLLSAASIFEEDAVYLWHVQDFEYGCLLDRIGQQLRTCQPGDIDNRARRARAGDSGPARDLLGGRGRHETPPYPSNLPSCFHRGDEFDVSGPETPKTKERRRGPMRDQTPLATSKYSPDESGVASRAGITNREGRSKERVEPPGNYPLLDSRLG